MKEEKILELIKKYPNGGIRNSDVARILKIQSSSKSGNHKNWKSWDILQKLVSEKKIKQNSNKKYYL